MSATPENDRASFPAPRIPRLARGLNRVTSPNSAPGFVLAGHRRLYERSAGRIGHGMIGAPTLLLRTVGRRSGRRRTSALVYARDGDGFVLAASNDGADRHPAWFHNVCAEPEVEIQVARTVLRARARVVSREGTGYEALWAEMNAVNHGRYAHYQAMTGRAIPLVILDVSASNISF